MTTTINEEKALSADQILILDDEETEASPDVNQLPVDLDEEEPITKHTLVTSPWSRLGMIGIPLGGGFLVFFLIINSLINGGNHSNIKTAESENDKTREALTDANDGDVYAQLALSKQAEELNKIDNQKTPPSPKQEKAPQEPKALPEVTVQRQPITVASTPPPPPRSVSRNYSPQPRAIATAPVQRNYAAVRPQSAINNSIATDPIEELNRLRSVGSFGKIVYNSAIDEPVSQEFEPELELIQTRSHLKKDLSTEVIQPQPEIQNNADTTIEKMRPRWLSSKSDKPMLVANNYLPQEAQILTEQQTRYLMVGEFANGVLVTPVMKQETRGSNPQQSSDNKRFVAKLTEDLHDNYGQVAIPSGTMLAVELVSVDAGSYASLEVTSIIKDNTEYPISRGAISVLADGGKPLIAKKFQDKGGEIAQYDITLGLVSGLGKIGSVLNESDSTTIINSSTNTFSSSSINSSRRNITGAFLEGAFGTLSDIISKRTETANTEIADRPNAWYIPKGTKITFMVNRTLELP